MESSVGQFILYSHKRVQSFRKSLYTLLLLSIAFLTSHEGYSQSTPFPISGSIDVCEGDVKTYSAPASNYTYVWSVSPGHSFIASTNVNVVSWGASGALNYIVLKVFNAGSLLSYDSIPINIHYSPNPQIVSDFDSDCIVPNDRKGDEPGGVEDSLSPCQTVCEGMTVTYTTPLISGNSYIWSVTGNFLSISNGTTNQSSITWGSPGQATISITETTPQGCSSTETVCIEVVAKPNSLFHVNDPNGAAYSVHSGNIPSIDICMGSQVSFWEDATGEILYNWDFGNGTSSTQANVSASYSNPGNYLVALTVENECHCTDVSYMYVNVEEFPGPEIVCKNVLCEDGTFSYSAIMPNGACPNGLYDWIVSGNGNIVEANGSPISPTNSYNGNGITSITVDWSSGPIGTISLNVSGCNNVCSQYTSVDIPIIPSSIDIEGKDVLCLEEEGHYSVQCYPGTVYNWIVDGNVIGEQGNDIWTSFLSPGTHTISVSYSNNYLGCFGGSANFTIAVLEPFEINGNDKICEGTSSSITGPLGSNLNWEVKNNSGIVVYSNTSGTNTYIFPNGFTAIPGNYTVIAYDAANPQDYCNEYAVHGITIIASPPSLTIINGPTQICEGESYIYTSAPSSTDYYLKWEVYNNSSTSTSNGNSVTVNWTAGTKWIKLYQISKENDCESLPQLINITEKTLTAISISGPSNPVCANTSTSSPEIYSASISTYDNYTWSISPSNAGSIVGGQGTGSVQVIWNNTIGSATVSVVPEVCDTVGLATNYPVTIANPPSFTISGPSTICELSQGIWTTSLTGTFDWEIKNALNNSVIASGSGSPVNYTFNQNGSFILIIDGQVNGCNGISTAIYNITVNPAPVANLSYTGYSKCISQSVVDFTVSVQGVAPYTYRWYQNNTLVSTTTSPNNTYSIGNNSAHAGDWYVNIIDNNGCRSNTNVIKISDNCPGGGGAQGGCNPVPGSINFDSTIFVLNNCTDLNFNALLQGTPSPTSYVWQIANLATIYGPNPNYSFPASGIYPVSLVTAFNPGDCEKTISKDVLIPIQSDMDIIIHCISNVMNVDLINTSNVVHGPLSNWNHQWEIYDGSLQVGPTYTTQNVTNISGLIPGTTYTVKLIVDRVYTWNGQSISASCEVYDSFTVPLPASAAFTINPFPDVCEDLPINFTDASAGDIISWLWDFNDGSGITTQNPDKTYENSGTYSVALTVTDDYGCTSISQSSTINVHSNTIAGTFSGIPITAICPGTNANITFNPSGSSGYNYIWTTGATTNNITIGQTSNNYVVVSDVNSCYREFGPAIVEIDEIPDPFIQGKDEYCVGEEIQLSCNYGSTYKYQWFRGLDTLVGDTNTFLNITEAVGSYNYSVELTSATPCNKLSASYQVVVHSLPTIPTILANPTPACPSVPVTLSVTNFTNYSSIAWTNGSTGNSMTTTSLGVYYAVGMDSNGCTSSSSDEIFELPEFCGFMCGCYSDCISAGDTFYFPGITGNFQYWEWQQYFSGSWQAIETGSGVIPDFKTANAGNYTIRLYVVTLNGCDGFSCEADINLTNCEGDEPLHPCEGDAIIEIMECRVDKDLNVLYDFNMSLNYFPVGMECEDFTFTVIPPSGSIINLSPGQLNQGANFITGTWNTGVTYYPGQNICFTVVVTNTCDNSQCIFEVCYDVESCGEDTTGGEIEPCNSGSAYINNVFCHVQDGKVQYNFHLNLNFVPFGDPCEQFNYSIVTPYGVTLIYATPMYLTSGNYVIAGAWLTGLSYVPGQEICFDVIMTNACDQTQCKFEVCFTVPTCGVEGLPDGTNEFGKGKVSNLSNSEIQFYPNPIKDELRVAFPIEGSYQVQIHSLSGKMIFNQQVLVENREVVQLNVEFLNSGIYNIRCIGHNDFKNDIIVIE